MQDDISQYAKEYIVNERDTQRVRASVTRPVNPQLKTVRCKSLMVRRDLNRSRNDSTVSKIRQLNDASVCSHLNIRELNGQGSNNNEQELEIPSFVFNTTEPMASPTQHSKPDKPTPTKKKCCTLPVIQHKTRIQQLCLALCSLAVLFLLPVCYSFLLMVFEHQEEYRITYIPSLPQQLKALVVYLFSVLAYVVLYLYYCIKTHLYRFTRIRRKHLLYFLIGVAAEQLITLVMWLPGLRLSEQVYERFAEDSHYERSPVVQLLLQWRVLWISNAVVLTINFLAGALVAGLNRFPSKGSAKQMAF